MGHKPKTHSKWVMIDEELDVNISKDCCSVIFMYHEGTKKHLLLMGRTNTTVDESNYFVTLKYVLCGEPMYTVFCDL